MLTKEQLVSFLKKKYNPTVILLGGSRVNGTHRGDSDWDIYLIGKYREENERVAMQYKDEHLDLALFPINHLKDNILKIFYGPLSDLEVLLDNDKKLGDKIVNATQKAYKIGPRKLPKKELKEKFEDLNRILSKIQGYNKMPEASFFHLTSFYQAIIPFWFQLHQEWSRPVQYAIPIIQKRDRKLFKLLNKLCLESAQSKRIVICKKIYKHLLNNVTSN